ncbi:hypothetical protein B2D45_14935 [Lactobacillus hilgardii]|uniref:Uncharacterized protein n=1 Tax=Lentilactobacillus hilgardii (strain ATCC 8290 / DSM 20176 / CCUG 30140 / JCM 1155 / KCTC 3500 / NBRC 15886 / NCIMB 8040 / NRRL B-1843 / 9) TaxID=1423757 RepID=C0XMZ2_LENH9|nr:hypothetical protein HMPREF0519_2603 [Lentilactobacillus hilgardii DSM 20176 = ATCC 8290]QEU38027.1 hypothetical protein LH500_03325 [Lentilactobacillus hilgardii]TDG84278.1 hypothetical protein C5L34_000503 [Lentilactobacillus hilgardii]
MQLTKQLVLNDLISLMDTTRNKAITSIKLLKPDDLPLTTPTWQANQFFLIPALLNLTLPRNWQNNF